MATTDGVRPPQRRGAVAREWCCRRGPVQGERRLPGRRGGCGRAAAARAAALRNRLLRACRFRGRDAAASAGASSNVDKWKGRRVKRFKLVDELGEGAMGRVFLAEDTVLKRHVALKLLPAKHRDGRPNHRTERLVREARSAASLEHPNAVHIYEIDQSGGVHYIAMELVEGGNLEKLVEMSGPMEVERACQLMAEAAEALSHARTCAASSTAT